MHNLCRYYNYILKRLFCQGNLYNSIKLIKYTKAKSSINHVVYAKKSVAFKGGYQFLWRYLRAFSSLATADMPSVDFWLQIRT